jgi:hypothetical protein
MFGFPRRSASRPRSTGLRQALARDGLVPGVDAATIGVVETHGQYAGRRVTYFGVFDQKRAATRAVSVRAVGDLDSHPDLLLGAGHVEQNGALVFAARAAAADGPAPARQPADRAAHADDAHLVFWDPAASATSAAKLSRAASAWLYARGQPSLTAADPTAAHSRSAGGADAAAGQPGQA